MKAKSFSIPKTLVYEAYLRVKANRGAAGVDHQSIDDFEKELKNNLYKVWNRMSSGTYFPPAVKAVEIPKKSGGVRVLGIPTVADRVAQMVIKLQLEPQLEPTFYDDSYGYRPRKSAHDAVRVTQQRCWQTDWVLEFDVKGLFDNIPHELILKALNHHVECRWTNLHVQRWLEAPISKDGVTTTRTKGTPQGGVISPLLANLFMHYAFDRWITDKFPHNKWCRYADDGLVHCKSYAEAKVIYEELKKRLESCGIEIHPAKTKIIYCRDSRRRREWGEVKFDFLGFTFRPRLVRNRQSANNFLGFTPGMSRSSTKSINQIIRTMRHRVDLSLDQLAEWINPKMRGWINYYGKFNRASLYKIIRQLHKTLVAWAKIKFKKLRCKTARAGQFLQAVMRRNPRLFYHWAIGMRAGFA